MFTDSLLRMATAEAVTASAISASWIDLKSTPTALVGRDLGEGYPLCMAITANTAATSATAGSTVEFRLISLPATVLSVASVATDIAAETLTIAAHGLLVGTPIFLTSIVTTTGVTANLTYFVTNPTTNTFQLATTLANAVAGTPVVDLLTGNGTVTVNYIPTIHASTGTIVKDFLPANHREVVTLRPILGPHGLTTHGAGPGPVQTTHRYLFVQYLVSATLTAGTFTIDLVLDIHDGTKAYPSGFTVT